MELAARTRIHKDSESNGNAKTVIERCVYYEMLSH